MGSETAVGFGSAPGVVKLGQPGTHECGFYTEPKEDGRKELVIVADVIGYLPVFGSEITS